MSTRRIEKLKLGGAVLCRGAGIKGFERAFFIYLESLGCLEFGDNGVVVSLAKVHFLVVPWDL